MSGPALLHNMSVPPISKFQVSSPGLAALAFHTTRPSEWTDYRPDGPPPPEEAEAAFARLRLPDRVGICAGAPEGEAPKRSIGYPAALAVLARRSGHLYLPWRPVYPALVPNDPVYVYFPLDGGRA